MQTMFPVQLQKSGGGVGIRTLGTFTFNGFQDRRFRPLSHPSRGARNIRDYSRFVKQKLINEVVCVRWLNLRVLKRKLQLK